MATVDAKKNRKKHKRHNGHATPAQPPAKPNGQSADPVQEPKKYSLTREEMAAYSMVQLRADLGKEKMTNARSILETAVAMRSQWAGQVFKRLALPPNARGTVDPDTGTITIQPEPQQAQQPPPPPAPEAQAPQPEAPPQ